LPDAKNRSAAFEVCAAHVPIAVGGREKVDQPYSRLRAGHERGEPRRNLGEMAGRAAEFSFEAGCGIILPPSRT